MKTMLHPSGRLIPAVAVDVAGRRAVARADELPQLLELLCGSSPAPGTEVRVTYFSADDLELEATKPEPLRRTVWRGALYDDSRPRTLVLGESWYEKRDRLQDAIEAWIGGAVDPTFARIFSAGTGMSNSVASIDQRRAFWDRIAFYNFAGYVGPDREYRPTKAHYERGVDNLERVLEELQPDAVWILGREQAGYSEKVVSARGITYAVTTHPSYRRGVKTADSRISWETLQASARTASRT